MRILRMSGSVVIVNHHNTSSHNHRKFCIRLTDITDVSSMTIGFFGSFAHVDKFNTIATNDSSAIAGTIPTFVKMVLTASTVRKVGNGIIGNTVRTMTNLAPPQDMYQPTQPLQAGEP